MDRLDQDARTLGQTAAVIGREFPARVLERVAGSERFEAGLPGLLRSGVVREVRRYPELEYSFRHGLLQEAARSTLTQARRAALCARVAEVFEELFADALDERMEMLAHYHAQSGNLSKALEYLDRSAERAEAWGQRDEAVRLWRRALRVAERMDDPEAANRLRERLGEAAEDPEPPAERATRPAGEQPARTRTRIGPYMVEGVAPTPGALARALTADDDARRAAPGRALGRRRRPTIGTGFARRLHGRPASTTAASCPGSAPTRRMDGATSSSHGARAVRWPIGSREAGRQPRTRPRASSCASRAASMRFTARASSTAGFAPPRSCSTATAGRCSSRSRRAPERAAHPRRRPARSRRP